MGLKGGNLMSENYYIQPYASMEMDRLFGVMYLKQWTENLTQSISGI